MDWFCLFGDAGGEVVRLCGVLLMVYMGFEGFGAVWMCVEGGEDGG